MMTDFSILDPLFLYCFCHCGASFLVLHIALHTGSCFQLLYPVSRNQFFVRVLCV
jgi:hypothetical protein